MADLTKTTFRQTGPNGEQVWFDSKISVDTTGQFRATIPDFLEGCRSDVKIMHRIERKRQTLAVYCATLDGCLAVVRSLIDDYLSCEIIKERVIVYCASSDVSFWRGANGTLFSNGYDAADNGGKQGNGCDGWHGNLSATTRKHAYSISIAAHVVDRVTYRKNNSEKVVYEKIDEADQFSMREYRQRLNAFSGLIPPDAPSHEWKEIPYTERGAEFFYLTMLSMCALADKIEMFFGDDKRVAIAIAKAQSAGLLE